MRSYADHTGFCLVELEKDEKAEDIIKSMEIPVQWYEQSYKFLEAREEYTDTSSAKEKTYKGNLLLFATRAGYTG